MSPAISPATLLPRRRPGADHGQFTIFLFPPRLRGGPGGGLPYQALHRRKGPHPSPPRSRGVLGNEVPRDGSWFLEVDIMLILLASRWTDGHDLSSGNPCGATYVESG